MDYLRSYKNIYDQNIILMFKGELTFDLVSAMIGSLEERLEDGSFYPCETIYEKPLI